MYHYLDIIQNPGPSLLHCLLVFGIVLAKVEQMALPMLKSICPSVHCLVEVESTGMGGGGLGAVDEFQNKAEVQPSGDAYIA